MQEIHKEQLEEHLFQIKSNWAKNVKSFTLKMVGKCQIGIKS